MDVGFFVHTMLALLPLALFVYAVTGDLPTVGAGVGLHAEYDGRCWLWVLPVVSAV